MHQVLEMDKLREAGVNTDFFPYCQVDGFIKESVLSSVLDDFPKINIRGSIPAHRLTYGPYFQALIDALYHDDLRALISDKFSIDLSDSYPMLTVRGHTGLRDGKIHTDTPSKLVTLLLYLNDNWSESVGNLRLLKDGSSLEHYFDEIIPSAGKLLAFKVTDNCWHGHYPFIGKRQTLQFNYVTHQHVVDSELKKHSRSYTFKNMVHSFGF